ncbi:glycosyltransferase [Umezawaea endophytica]|uniref:Glycosyltransferase n=1 Tax=Umezawaea endophytica TaxID=1654476 RepID=A0A9X2VJ90_9PSEU|nr:glycosyltransferase [Umezawaea endophytica]MCS7477581.1 glycosyltransferase [Umezawaea endophytica]
MRIDMVAASWENDPVEQKAHVAGLAGALSGQGHDVTLYVRRDSRALPERRRTPHGYDLVRMPVGPTTPLPMAELLPHLDGIAAYLDRGWEQRAPDVVHLHSWTSGLAVRESDAPLVQSFHALKVVEDRFQRSSGSTARWRIALERLIAISADRVIAASNDEVAELGRIGVPRSRMSLVPWGLDPDQFSPDGPTASRGPRGRVLAVGEVLPRNGFHTAIDALATVPGAELVIADPVRRTAPRHNPEVSRLVQYAEKRSVAHRVRFTGEVTTAALPALLRSADVVVCVPWYEQSGITSLRAMSCGIPVVAARVGALADVVVDGLTGVLVPPHDPVALGRALRDLLANRLRCQFYSIAGADRVRARYSWDHVAAETVRAYRQAVPARDGRATSEMG